MLASAAASLPTVSFETYGLQASQLGTSRIVYTSLRSPAFAPQ